MPNAAGMIRESIWRDEDWRKLSRGAQALYMQLLSQKELDCAGLLPLQPAKWAKGCNGLTVEEVWEQLGELQTARFVFFDVDTDELLIRTHIRNSNVIKIPNSRASAMRAAKLAASERLREVLADELMATGRDDFARAAQEINPSATVSEPLANGSEINGSLTVTEPLANPRVLGTGTRNSHLGNYSSREGRPSCPIHPQGDPGDVKCHGCRATRIWDEQHAAELAADELEAKRLEREAAKAVVAACGLCDDAGWLLGADGLPCDPAMRCDHQEAAHA